MERSKIAPDLQLAIQALHQGESAQAIQLLTQLLNMDQSNVAVLKVLAKAHILAGDELEAKTCLEKVIALDSDCQISRLNLGELAKREHQFSQAMEYFQSALESALEQPPQINLRVPPILINTLPKSGSVYIIQTMQAHLKYASLSISSDIFFSNDLIRTLYFYKSFESPHLLQEHLPALPDNLQLMAHLNRWVVHVRDPRQALLSWVFFLEKETSDLQQALRLQYIPSYYSQLAFKQKLDWQIKHHLPLLVQWLEGWMKSDSPVLFTYYRDLKNQPETFFKQIYEFFELDFSDFQLPSPKPGQQHYRKGELNEWRDVFSQKQQSNANQLIPEDVFQFFKWEY